MEWTVIWDDGYMAVYERHTDSQVDGFNLRRVKAALEDGLKGWVSRLGEGLCLIDVGVLPQGEPFQEPHYYEGMG